MLEVFSEAGAIPYRIKKQSIQVLLITTSSGKNMTIPKGLIDPGYSATETAMNEAYEEAGIRGRLLTPSLGSYAFKKWGGRCEVKVFVMAVTHQLNKWPEKEMRRRMWATVEAAAQTVKHLELGALIRKLPEQIKSNVA